MADSSHGPASFWTQANALLRKNLTFQKRNIRSNVRLVLFPMFLCMILILIQTVVNNELNKPGSEFKCGCSCVKNPNGNGKCEQKCGMQYSSSKQAAFCLNPSPPEWPPLLQIPANEFRAVHTDSIPFKGLPADSCRKTGSCPGIILSTGANLTLGKSLGENMIPSSLTMNPSDVLDSLANAAAGSASNPQLTNFIEPAFSSNMPVYFLQNQCFSNMPFLASSPLGPPSREQEISCLRGLNLWRNSSSEINDELYKGYRKGNPQKDINEIIGAYDFLNTDANKFNVSVWYNSTYKNDSGNRPISVTRVSRSVNLASNAYLQFLLGPGAKIQFEFVKEMPKIETKLQLDFAMLGPLFFTWVILQLFPVVLTSLVYEKQQRLRIMMKMHGLGDGPYWMISYSYFLLLSALYMIVFITFGSLIGLNFFRKNAYSIQAVFYFLCINLQVSFAFLVAALFSSVKTASVVAYILVFGTGLLGGFLLQSFVEDSSFPRGWITGMELYPGFALYRGLYEFAEHAVAANFLGTAGMQWKDLSDKNNGMREVLIIISVEWLVVFFVALCSDQIVSYRRSPLFFMQNQCIKTRSSFRKPSLERQGSNACVQMEKLDVLHEKEKVEQLLLDSSISQAIVCDDLKKVYRGRDGNQDKFAVRGLSLAVSRGECFGMLGPNGAGKTSFINMMIGLIKSSSGTAYVEGLDIQTQMNRLYTFMGVCPQHDLLWETLTGREHLLFYGRLKNLKGPALSKAVEESLKSVNLFNGGIADKQAGKYSGGMKRRLSVAISLIGDPKVVYMDEPSTGLDPASRNNLWSVVKRAKQDRAIILTTHSMEEAERLCDRLGIFVDGSLQCIGDPKELKARYGGSYVFTVTTSASHEGEVENLVRKLSPNAVRTYQISGTQKFELPKHETKIADVFQAVEEAKNRFPVHAWGLADTTLEDVFIKVARGAQAFNVLS